MEILKVQGDEVSLLFSPLDGGVSVGQPYLITEASGGAGVVVQILSHQTVQYPGLETELLQRTVESQLVRATAVVDRELGLEALKTMKSATAKIRAEVDAQGRWRPWRGLIPSRTVQVRKLESEELLGAILPPATLPLPAFFQCEGTPIHISGPSLGLTSVIAGDKGSGKSVFAKHLAFNIAQSGVPVVVFDANSEYGGLPGANALRLGENWWPTLSELGPQTLVTLVRSLMPFAPSSPSEAVFEARLPTLFRGVASGDGPPLDLRWLREQKWGGGEYVERAITSRLENLDRMGLFWNQERGGTPATLDSFYEAAVSGDVLVIDLSHLSHSLQKAVSRAMTHRLEQIAEREDRTGRRAWPTVFFEEAHLYVSEAGILSLCTLARHKGIASVFVTNSPSALPDYVLRSADNLVVMRINHRDDLRTLGKAAAIDSDTLEALTLRTPERHALISGRMTSGYPLMVAVDPLPEMFGRGGRTRSPWDRFVGGATAEISAVAPPKRRRSTGEVSDVGHGGSSQSRR